jgi:hypothetical protein
LASALVSRLGRDLLVPEPVIVEVDQLLRSRVGGHAARLFLAALAAGEHETAFLTAGLLRRATEIDEAQAAACRSCSAASSRVSSRLPQRARSA